MELAQMKINLFIPVVWSGLTGFANAMLEHERFCELTVEAQIRMYGYHG